MRQRIWTTRSLTNTKPKFNFNIVYFTTPLHQLPHFTVVNTKELRLSCTPNLDDILQGWFAGRVWNTTQEIKGHFQPTVHQMKKRKHERLWKHTDKSVSKGPKLRDPKRGGGGGGSLETRKFCCGAWSPEKFDTWSPECLRTVKPGSPNEMLWSPGTPIFLSWSPGTPLGPWKLMQQLLHEPCTICNGTDFNTVTPCAFTRRV